MRACPVACVIYKGAEGRATVWSSGLGVGGLAPDWGTEARPALPWATAGSRGQDWEEVVTWMGGAGLRVGLSPSSGPLTADLQRTLGAHGQLSCFITQFEKGPRAQGLRARGLRAARVGRRGRRGNVGWSHRLVLASSRIFQMTRCIQALASSLELCPSTTGHTCSAPS